MTKELTREEMLKEIVERAVTGGWLANPHQDTEVTIRVFQYGRIELSIENNPKFTSELWKGSVHDMIMDSDAMKAVFGKSEDCIYLFKYRTGKQKEFAKICHNDDYVDNYGKYTLCDEVLLLVYLGGGSVLLDEAGCHSPAYKHHSLKACELILDGGDAVKYLYEQMPEPTAITEKSS